MTGNAGLAGKDTVIDDSGCRSTESRCRVTGIAWCEHRDMFRWLAQGKDAVMTT